MRILYSIYPIVSIYLCLYPFIYLPIHLSTLFYSFCRFCPIYDMLSYLSYPFCLSIYSSACVDPIYVYPSLFLSIYYLPMQEHTYQNTYKHRHRHGHTNAHINPHIHTYTHTYICIRVHSHVDIHMMPILIHGYEYRHERLCMSVEAKYHPIVDAFL